MPGISISQAYQVHTISVSQCAHSQHIHVSIYHINIKVAPFMHHINIKKGGGYPPGLMTPGSAPGLMTRGLFPPLRCHLSCGLCPGGPGLAGHPRLRASQCSVVFGGWVGEKHI